LLDESSVSQLYDRLRSIVDKPVPVARWETRKDLFYKNLSPVLSGVKQPDTISPEKHAEIQKKAKEAAALNVELQEELDKKEKELIETREAKDAKQVATIRQKYSSEMAQYDALIDQCRSALKALPRVVREAFFYKERHEEFIPDDEDFDYVRSAQEDEELQKAYGSEHGLEPNTDRPKIQRADQALEKLRLFLEEASAEFAEVVKQRFGDTADLRRKSYWRAMDLF
jgi:hypothetical protein